MIRPSVQNKKNNDRILELVHKINWGIVQADLKDKHCLWIDEIKEIDDIIKSE
jgi:hypothetical protein